MNILLLYKSTHFNLRIQATNDRIDKELFTQHEPTLPAKWLK